MVHAEMQHAEVNGGKLAIWDIGSGEPVLFVHGAFGDQCMAMLSQPTLTDNFRIIHYQQRGWGYSAPPDAPPSVEERAADCRAVMEHVGVDRVHLALSSMGSLAGLQTALDNPETVHTLTLMEPLLPDVMQEYPEFLEALQEVGALYQSGDKQAATDRFARLVGGPDYQSDLDRTLPDDWFDRWVEGMDTLFMYDMPGGRPWTFTRENAARITQPVLNVTAEHTDPYFRDVHERLKTWIPQAENVLIPNATHLMQESNPVEVAGQLSRFFAKHPMSS